MSYDLMIFSSEAAPKTRADFMLWYARQTAWTEGHSYQNPTITTPGLRSWYLDMMQTFPDMNGPEATDDHTSEYETDYTIGRAVIYAAFSWRLAEEANTTARQLAQKHQVGLYDPSFNGPILVPHNGQLKPMEGVNTRIQDVRKPWWKVW
ncbi:hypothetical protein [Hymenobacter sp. APR13]|uniref:hypothetical protein n=1 Tax=Hymenobacter sp. APR13 TaxID=1356852 RepID=UPI0004E05D6B|nr:hypothetical protein [Hymenobacter sp. APR13]AII52638.1 hypothetical protein N008_11720 [Hymenobacter sp. APR13]